MFFKTEEKLLKLSLEDFEGPLELLVHLVQKKELKISEIPLKCIFAQYAEHMPVKMDSGAEFIGTMAFLMWLKSCQLVPQHTLDTETEEMTLNPFEALPHVLEYCQFKEIAALLSERQQQQGDSFPREAPDPRIGKLPLGIEHISLDDLAHLFQDVLSKAPEHGLIEDEEYLLSDMIQYIRDSLKATPQIPFTQLFHPQKPRPALIVTFLAILELLKLGEILIVRDTQTQTVYIRK